MSRSTETHYLLFTGKRSNIGLTAQNSYMLFLHKNHSLPLIPQLFQRLNHHPCSSGFFRAQKRISEYHIIVIQIISLWLLYHNKRSYVKLDCFPLT